MTQVTYVVGLIISLLNQNFTPKLNNIQQFLVHFISLILAPKTKIVDLKSVYIRFTLFSYIHTYI